MKNFPLTMISANLLVVLCVGCAPTNTSQASVPVLSGGTWSLEVKSMSLPSAKGMLEIIATEKPKVVRRNSAARIILLFNKQNSIDWDDKTVDSGLSSEITVTGGNSVAFYVKPDYREGHLVLIYDFRDTENFRYCWFDEPFENQSRLLGDPAIAENGEPNYDFDGSCVLTRLN